MEGKFHYLSFNIYVRNILQLIFVNLDFGEENNPRYIFLFTAGENGVPQMWVAKFLNQFHLNILIKLIRRNIFSVLLIHPHLDKYDNISSFCLIWSTGDEEDHII